MQYSAHKNETIQHELKPLLKHNILLQVCLSVSLSVGPDYPGEPLMLRCTLLLLDRTGALIRQVSALPGPLVALTYVAEWAHDQPCLVPGLPVLDHQPLPAHLPPLLSGSQPVWFGGAGIGHSPTHWRGSHKYPCQVSSTGDGHPPKHWGVCSIYYALGRLGQNKKYPFFKLILTTI